MCRMGTPGLAGLGSWSCTPGLSGSPRLGHRCLRLPAGLQRCRQPRQLKTWPQVRRGLSSRTRRPRRGRGSATARGSGSRADVPPRTRPRSCPHRKTRRRWWLSGTGNPRGFGHVAGLCFATRNRRRWQDTEDGRAAHGGREHPDAGAIESRCPQGIRVKEMSPQQPCSATSVPSLASQLLVSTQNDSSSPSPCHGPFFQVPEGARVRANALAETQPCPSTGTAKGRRTEERLGGKYPGKAAQREGEASHKKMLEPNIIHPVCLLPAALLAATLLGQEPRMKKKDFIVGTKLGSIAPNRRWHLGSHTQMGAEGCKTMLWDAKPCRGMHGELPIDALPPAARGKGRV